MKRRSDLLAALAGAAILLIPALASAYCRTANCPSHKGAWQVCVPAVSDDCGELLWWKSRCLGYSLQKDASSQVSLADMEKIVSAAFDTWIKADCGGGGPAFTVEYQGPVECDKQEYNTDKTKGNANIIMFRDDSWPYAGTANILALTTVTYNLDTSEIYDADMEINSADIKDLTIGDSGVKYDLPSIITHETGHFLGLAHSHTAEATMYPDYKPMSTDLRTLDQDDVDGICAVFPPDNPSDTCDAEPRHGFSELCAADQTEEKGCSCSVPGGTGEGGGLGLGAIGAFVGIGLWRRRRAAGKKAR